MSGNSFRSTLKLGKVGILFLIISSLIPQSMAICGILLNVGCFNLGIGNTGFFNTGAFNQGIGQTGFANGGILNAGLLQVGVGNVGILTAGAFNGGVLQAGHQQHGLLNAGVVPKVGLLNVLAFPPTPI